MKHPLPQLFFYLWVLFFSLFGINRSHAQFSQQGPKLVGTDAAGKAYQGYSVAISGDGNTAVVGAYNDNNGAGAAFIFARSGTTWSQQGPKLVGTGAVGVGQIFQGVSVAISADGNTVAVGANQDNNGIGAVFIFTRSGTTWSQQGSKLVGTGAVGYANQGYSVALSSDGNTVLIGGLMDGSLNFDDDFNPVGAVWVFTRSGSTWSQQGPKLVGTGAVGSASQGSSVAISSDGNTALVGGYFDNDRQGATWVFTRSGNTWSQQGPKLVGMQSDPTTYQEQGSSVVISADGNTSAVGSRGGLNGVGWAFIFTRSGTAWSQQGSKLVGGYRNVALSGNGNILLLGGLSGNNLIGFASAFTRSGSSWAQQESKLTGTGGVGSGSNSVALSGDGTTALVGGHADNDFIGAVWVFQADCIPSVSVAASPGTTITAGTSITFSATPTDGGTAPTYVWKKNDVIITDETGPTYSTATLANGDKIKVEMTSNATCASSTTVTSNEITITVTLTPTCTTPAPYLLTGGGIYCEGSSGVAVGLANSEAGVIYQLKKDNINVGSPIAGTGVAISFGNQTAANYTVEATRTMGGCTATMTGTVNVSINTKPTITLTVNSQTFGEGNNPTLCDTDANPVNGVKFTVLSSCVAGNPVWRVQAGSGAWSAWSDTAPSSQPSNNIIYRYQAACGENCTTSYTTPIAITINYRASTPQNVSLLIADATTLIAGEIKTICNTEGNSMAFNATCALGEILLYSVDGGDYSALMPSQIVDNNFHNYRVRCRKIDGTPSCIETESAAISLKISPVPLTPTISITPVGSCGSAAPFSGSSTCGSLTTVWYNAATNQAQVLPTTTPNATASFYARCRNEAGCEGPKSNNVTFTFVSLNDAPLISASAELVCAGTEVTVTANCPSGTTVLWNTGITEASFKVSFNNATKATYAARCVFTNGCQSPASAAKTLSWKAFELTFINVGQSKSASKSDSKAAWSSQFITPDAGPSLDYSTQVNPTIYYSENVNKTAPRFWTIHTETCNLGTEGSLTFNMLGTPELGVLRSYNTHENNAPYFMYANRAGFTELYAQNHPAYGFFADNGSGGNVHDEGLPKGLYKLGIRYWDQKGQGSIYPSTRQPAGNVLAYQEYWFRIQSKNGVGTGATRTALNNDKLSDPRTAMSNAQWTEVAPNPISSIMHLKASDSKGEKVNVSLLDASGRTLMKREFVAETNQHQEEFEVSHLSNGVYFLKVNTPNKQATLKVVKMN